MSTEELLPRTRFLDTLGLVRHEGKHLAYSLTRVFSQPVNGAWVRGLEQRPEQAATARETFGPGALSQQSITRQSPNPA